MYSCVKSVVRVQQKDGRTMNLRACDRREAFRFKSPPSSSLKWRELLFRPAMLRYFIVSSAIES
jgi:hypothetical protein